MSEQDNKLRPSKNEIQAWIDHRFGTPNTINIQVYLDMRDFTLAKVTSMIQTEWRGCVYLKMQELLEALKETENG